MQRSEKSQRDFVRAFHKLSKSVREAIVILRKAPGKVRTTQHDGDTCPIATGFKVTAVEDYWRYVKKVDKEKLSKHGFNGYSYNKFITWYDCMDSPALDMKDQEYKEEERFREKLLRWCLTQKRLPRIRKSHKKAA